MKRLLFTSSATLVVHRGRFMNTNLENTGKVHGARMLSRLGLYLRGGRKDFIPHNDMVLYHVSVPTVISGDHTYPLLTQFIKQTPTSVTLETGNSITNCVAIEWSFNVRLGCLHTRPMWPMLSISSLHSVYCITFVRINRVLLSRVGTGQNWFANIVQTTRSHMHTGPSFWRAREIQDAICVEILQQGGKGWHTPVPRRHSNPMQLLEKYKREH